jgi:hypothetical protein
MIPKRFQANCDMCGDPLNTNAKNVSQREIGYVMNRSGGGANGVRCMVRLPYWRCKLCVEKESRGRATYQMGLFE